MKLKTKTCRILLIAGLGVALAPLAISSAHADDMSNSTTAPMPAMMPMTPSQASGTVLRHYVDTMGNVTAVDIQTSTGAEMVRFSPPIPSGDIRLNTLMKGAKADVMGLVTAGVSSYQPEAAMMSGLLASGAKSAGMASGGMSSGGTGMMSSFMAPVSTMNLSTVMAPAGSIKALVTLPDGRVTAIKEMDGKNYYISPDNGQMMEVTDPGMVLPMAIKGAKVWPLSPDGTMAMASDMPSTTTTTATDAAGKM